MGNSLHNCREPQEHFMFMCPKSNPQLMLLMPVRSLWVAYFAVSVSVNVFYIIIICTLSKLNIPPIYNINRFTGGYCRY